MELKRFKFAVKSVSEAGEFSGYASVFDNIDLGGDIIERGAFKRTIDHSKGKVPILNSHDSHSEIGMTTSLKEDNHGLLFSGQLYIDSVDPMNEIPDARLAYVRMKRRLEFEKPLGMSIGYDVVQKENDGVMRRLKELKLWEISPVTFAMNPMAGINAVKSGEKSMVSSLEVILLEYEALKGKAEHVGHIYQAESLKEQIERLKALLEAVKKSDSGQPHSEVDGEHERARKKDDSDMDSFVKTMQDIRAEIIAL